MNHNKKRFTLLLLYQEESGFLFNSDAHFLYDFISRFPIRGALLDLGCGCGILGLLCARDLPVSVTLLDRQPHNTMLAAQNARVNDIEAEVIEGDFLETDMPKSFDVVVSNPPYYHDGADTSDNDKIALSRAAGFLPFEAMISRINRCIRPRGRLIFCYDAKQLPMLMRVLQEKRFTVCDIRFVHGRADRPAHLVLIHARKGARSLAAIHPPLIHFDGEEMSEEVKSIYQKTRTYSIKCRIS